MPNEMESSPPLDSIRTTLILFQNCLAERRLEVDRALQRCEATHISLRATETRNCRAIEKLQSRNHFLQQTAYEEIPSTSGNANPKFERTKIFQHTPDFHFALRTQWPIRSVEVDPSYDPKRWNPFPWYTTQTKSFEFIATLKNKRYESAEAKVRLFGWRHEIHQDEILRNKEHITRLISEQSKLKKECAAVVIQIQVLKTRCDVYDIKLADIGTDLKALDQEPVLFDSNGQLEQNIYTLCQGYGLTTTIEYAEISPSLNVTWTSKQSFHHLNKLQELQQVTNGILKVLKKRHNTLSHGRRDDIALIGQEIQEMSTGMKPSDLKYLGHVVSRGNSAEGSIARQALQSLESLDAQTNNFVSRRKITFDELLNDRRQPLDDSQFGDTIDDLDGYLNKDLEATECAVSMINQTHIGVAAASYLLVNESVIEGWMALLDDLSRHMDLSALAAPTKGEDIKGSQPENRSENTVPDATKVETRGVPQASSKVGGAVRVTTFQVPWSTLPVPV